jgi:hypothetical protein
MLLLIYTLNNHYNMCQIFSVRYAFASCCFIEASILMSLPADDCLATDYLNQRFLVYSYPLGTDPIENTTSNSSSVVVRVPLPSHGLLVYWTVTILQAMFK